MKRNQDQLFKWAYTFFLAVLTVGWGVFCVWVTYKALMQKETLDIFTVSGANVMFGFMLAMWKDVNQFWFRKQVKQDVNESNSATITTDTGVN